MGWIFDEQLAQRPIDFAAKYLTHVKGRFAGRPYVLLPFQQDMIRKLYGWVDEDTKLRKHRIFCYLCPRKNGKSFLITLPCLYGLIADNEPGAEVILAASTRDQASELFDVIAAQVSNSPALAKRLKVLASKKRILHPSSHSYLQAVSSDSGGLHGKNISVGVCDEVHCWRDDELYAAIETSMGARQQPLLCITSTAGFNKASLLGRLWDYAEKVRDNIVVNDSWLPYIYSAKPDDDWESEDTWRRCNPCLGDAISLDYLTEQSKIAKEIPAKRNEFLRLHLNTWTEQEVLWLPLDHWGKCNGDIPDGVTKNLCHAGLDLSTTSDMTSLALAWDCDGVLYLRVFFWMPRDTALVRQRECRVPFSAWARDARARLTLTDGNVVDYDRLEADILKICQTYRITGIYYDRYNSTQIVQHLMAKNIKMNPIGQGFVSMNAPAKELERRILAHTLCHEDNPVLDWQASVVSIKMDDLGNIRPVKPDFRKQYRKIDGIVAGLMAIAGVIGGDRGNQVPDSAVFM